MPRLFSYNITGILLIISVSLAGQSSDFSYQIILESKNQYNEMADSSALSSLTQLYPILTFENTLGNLSNKLQAEGYLTNYNFRKDSVSFIFQELFTQFSLQERHFWTFGKKRLDWGTGTLWNPTNFYIQKDPFRTQNRLEGIFLLNYTYLFNKGSLQLYVFPEKKWKDFGYALKYNYTGERTDASISFLQYDQYQQVGYDISYGGDLFIAYSEGSFRNHSHRSGLWTEVVAGGSIILNPYISTRAEYRFREDSPQLHDPISISKHSLFGSVEWRDLFDIWSLQLRTFYDPVSGQLIISPLAVWRKNNFQIELSSMVYSNALHAIDFQLFAVLSCHF